MKYQAVGETQVWSWGASDCSLWQLALALLSFLGPVLLAGTQEPPGR